MMFIFKHTRRAAAVLMLAALGFSGLMAQGNDEKVYKVGEDGVTAPKVKQKVDPVYTDDAKAAKITGAVLIAFEIDADGHARNLKVVRSLEAGLDVKALNALTQWEFEPATKDGQPVICSAQVEINFALL